MTEYVCIACVRICLHSLCQMILTLLSIRWLASKEVNEDWEVPRPPCLCDLEQSLQVCAPVLQQGIMGHLSRHTKLELKQAYSRSDSG